MTQAEMEAEFQAHRDVILPLYTEYMKADTSEERRAELLSQIETLDLALHQRMIPIFMASRRKTS